MIPSTLRIVRQLRNDPRTIALVLVAPALLLTLLYYVFADVPAQPSPFRRIGPIMLAVLPMLMMFLVTSVAMLRERTSGTLERILTTPVSKWGLIGAYGLVFGLLGLLQAAVLSALILWAFDLEVKGPWWALLVVALADALIGVSFGILASSLATNEFQAVQFMPVFVGPQLFLCGLLVPTEHMPRALELVAHWLPMTWAVDVVREITAGDAVSWLKVAGIFALSMVVLFLASLTLRRKTR